MLAIHGGTPVRQSPLPERPPYGSEEEEAAADVVHSGNLSGFLAGQDEGGPRVQDLEKAWRCRFGVRHAVSMNSATSCLSAAVQAVGVGRRDEVIVPPWSMSASAACVLDAGAVPIFADIETETYGLCYESVRDRITPRTKAIVLVDLFGCPAREIGLIQAHCAYHGLPLIEDAAQAPGARWHNSWSGTVGPVGVFSLNRHKTIQCGEGGVAVTNDDNVAAFLRGYRNHGEVINYRQGYVGGNHRLGEVEAAIAEVQLSRLEELTSPRIRNADQMTEALSHLAGIVPPCVPRHYRHVYYLYAFQVDVDAQRFARALTAEGVPASPYVEPLYRLPLFRGYGRRDDSNNWEGWYPGVERAYRHVVTLPHIHAGVTSEDVEDIIRAVCKVHDHRSQV